MPDPLYICLKNTSLVSLPSIRLRLAEIAVAHNSVAMEYTMSSRSSSLRGDSIWRGIFIGLIPLGLLVVIIVITLFLTTLMRQLFVGAGFFVQQRAELLVVIPGLILALLVYGVTIWLTLRHIASWQQAGAKARANGALWMLGITALLVVLPVVLAVVLPQHPAP